MSLEDIMGRSPLHYDFEEVVQRMKAPRECGTKIAGMMAGYRNECKEIAIEVDRLHELIEDTLLRVKEEGEGEGEDVDIGGEEAVQKPKERREPSEQANG